ncbi:5'-nucleotidase, lipoprotein e(P4) family [Neobacillus sp. SuZ13]|nr:5'-nucleotidase, lipoprotein e(P4) family [Neobacillus sp. SuZ13]WHY68248.1 5'-nucleotidase, lipoprotein e(P4) family [Neobacillus sp. SuZ13]
MLVLNRILTIITAAFFIISLTNFRAHAEKMASLSEQNTMSVLWFQKAGEAKGLYYQGYNIGKMRLDEIFSKKRSKNALKPAIVLDIDETILNNSPHQAWYVLAGRKIPFNWNEWFKRAEAKPLPGAIEFLQYAKSLGVEIFYISNRYESQKDATIKNLQSVGAPQADVDHVLLIQPGEVGKETRRHQVAKTHEILLLFGDNLGDFSGFDKLSVTKRNQAVDKYRDEFGKKLILFPNPMYGDWEGAIYNYNYKISDEEKIKLRRKLLEIYR